jgi:hypothetical protein
MEAIFKIGDKVNFYDLEGTITDVKQLNETTFEYTINNRYKTIQESDWGLWDWEDYIEDKPYHPRYVIRKEGKLVKRLTLKQHFI